MKVPPFHLAFPIENIEKTRRFYVDILGCKEGRSTERWIDFDFFGHQLSAHVSMEKSAAQSEVDGKPVPLRHFGAILERKEWEDLRVRIEQAHIPFVIQPHVRFQGKPGEQATLFIRDPSGNGLEFKSFTKEKDIFTK